MLKLSGRRTLPAIIAQACCAGQRSQHCVQMPRPSEHSPRHRHAARARISLRRKHDRNTACALSGLSNHAAAHRNGEGANARCQRGVQHSIMLCCRAVCQPQQDVRCEAACAQLRAHAYEVLAFKGTPNGASIALNINATLHAPSDRQQFSMYGGLPQSVRRSDFGQIGRASCRERV